MAAAFTLRRELVESIRYKFPNVLRHDDMQWPTFSPHAVAPKTHTRSSNRDIFDDSPNDDEGIDSDEDHMRKYWEHVLARYKADTFVQCDVGVAEVNSCLPTACT